MCVCIIKKHAATHAAARQSLIDSNKKLFFGFFLAWLTDSALKSATYALYSPGWIRRPQRLSLSDSGASGTASWTEATARVPTCVIWIKVSIYVSVPVMRCALSCTSCIHFLFVWVQSLGDAAHPASVTSSAPPSSPGGARRGDRKCIRSAVHWVTRSMVARGPGLADGVPAVAAAVFKAPRIYDYSLNPHGGRKRSRDRWGGEVKGSKVWPCVSCRISA